MTSWPSRMLVLLVNVGVGLGLMLLKQRGEGQPPKEFWGVAVLFGLSVAAVLFAGFKDISPSWTAGKRLAALFVMTMAGVFLFVLALTALGELERARGLPPGSESSLSSQIHRDGPLAVILGLLARQVAFFFVGACIGFPIWLPLWLLNYFLFKKMK
ncbi:MAG: hypothetical protein HY077_08430 [Elusimicrobia bacterium]|nr:hypothetical protein [Elusimicrobiota bacterium]